MRYAARTSPGVGRSGQVLSAAALAGVVSGAPSTVHALATGRDPLAATRAAATLACGDRHDNVVGGIVVHAAISVGWAAVLARLSVRSAATGAIAGIAIAALDLGLVGRHRPAIRALPLLPQVADHVVFGAVVGAYLGRRSLAAPSR